MKKGLTFCSVKVKYDEYAGFPHYFWSFPSAALKDVAEQYNSNLVKGIEFVLS
jgi:versiconal hemiacetal acetate esterase